VSEIPEIPEPPTFTMEPVPGRPGVVRPVLNGPIQPWIGDPPKECPECAELGHTSCWEVAYRAGREDAARDRDDQIRRAARRLVARIVANAHLLDVPFSDAPDRSPWTELKRDMNALYEVVGIRLGFAPWGDQPRTLLQGEVQDNPEDQR
jgi:hypothetical protein